MNSYVNNNILRFDAPTPKDLRLAIATRVKARRLEMNLTQKGMSARSGIPLATYRRFEAIGEISLSNLIMVAVVFGMTEDFEKIFSEKRYQNIDEVINAGKAQARMRGRKND